MTDHTTNKKCCNKKEKRVIKKRLVLFFDDFERSKLDRIELMGVINEYSENRKIKVIIIADEEKIVSKKADENNSDVNHQKDNTNNTNFDTTDSNFKYSEFKEKLISRTLKRDRRKVCVKVNNRLPFKQ